MYLSSVEVTYSFCPAVVFSGLNFNVADLSASFNPVNSVSVTTAPLQLCQFGLALAMQDSSCSEVESDYQHKRSRRKSGP